MIEQSITTLQQNREKITLLGYFAIILILTRPLATFLGAAYESGNISRVLIDLHLLVEVIDLEGVSVFLLGIFVGLLVLLTIDPKKRWQGYLLWIGLGIAMLGLRSMDLFIPNITFTAPLNLTWLTVGVILGLFAGGGRKLLKTQNAEALEFRSAALGIYLMVVLLILVSLFEYHLAYPEWFTVTTDGLEQGSDTQSGISVEGDDFIQNVIISSIFLVTVRRFIQYDAKEDFFVLGPRGSGKSLFLIGSYLEALNRDRDRSSVEQTPLQPSQDLMAMVEKLDQRNSEWIVEATGRGEIKTLEFQYVQGSIFPKNVKISSVDYAGEYLSRLPDALSGAISEEDRDNTLTRLSRGVQSSDTLILLVDLERFIDNEPLEITEYFSILQSAGNKDILIVATKADVLADQFRREQAIEPHLAFDEFQEYVERQLRQSEQVDTLMRESISSDIHPVYYQTKTNENDKLVPMRDETGSVMTIGFKQLLERLGR